MDENLKRIDIALQQADAAIKGSKIFVVLAISGLIFAPITLCLTLYFFDLQ